MAEHLRETGRPEDSPARREAAPPPDVPTTGATRAEAFEETGRVAKAEYRAAVDAPDFREVDEASVRTKVNDYVMNPDHPDGRNKLRVIQSATGLGPEDTAHVSRQVIDGSRDGIPVPGRIDQWGQRWHIDMDLTGPRGSLTVRTAWTVDAEASTPRLVTVSFPPKDR
jgi:hypothetical protein